MTRTVYVSSSEGEDRNDGLSPATSKKTLAEAKGLMRHGFPDAMLLKRGDVWNESLGHWKKSGLSPSEPMVVSTWGSGARPLIQSGVEGGIWTNGGGSAARIDFLSLVGLHFRPDGYTGGGNCVGGEFLQPGSHLTIEDCVFEGYCLNLVFQGYGGRHHDFRLLRSTIIDSWTVHAIGGHSQGLYAYAVDGLLIADCVFDHNGWNERVAGAGADVFSHNVYIDNDNTNVVVSGNVIANASSHGMQLRPGGSAIDNLFLRNSIALSVGGGDAPEPNGVTAEILDNVILDGKDIDSANPRGWGMWFANIASGRVLRNVIANNKLGRQPNVMTLDGDHRGVGVHDLAIRQNVFYKWGGGFLVEGDVESIEFIENRGTRSVYPDPKRSPASFVGGTYEAFIETVRLNGSNAAAVNRYIREGFSLE